jgi:cytochrome c biogenesis protein CcdA
MRYATILTLALVSMMTGVAFLFEWREVFAVLAVITVILIGLPVLSLASDFWFGETAPQLHVYDHHDQDYDRCRGSIGATAGDDQTREQPVVKLF